MTILNVLDEIDDKLEKQEYDYLPELMKILRDYFNDIRFETDYKLPIHLKNKI